MIYETQLHEVTQHFFRKGLINHRVITSLIEGEELVHLIINSLKEYQDAMVYASWNIHRLFRNIQEIFSLLSNENIAFICQLFIFRIQQQAVKLGKSTRPNRHLTELYGACTPLFTYDNQAKHRRFRLIFLFRYFYVMFFHR